MSEEKKEKNLDIAASKESNETEQKIDAVATKRNSISKRYLIISNDLLQINNSVPVHTVLY